MRNVLFALLIAMTPTMAVSASLDGGWTVNCPYSHSRPDDPIKFPGQQGVSHLHDFFGSTTTNSASTYNSMVGSPTTCGTSGDTSGYWMPALYRDGVKVNPAGKWGSQSVREKFYYREDHYLVGTRVEPFPANFKMIQGYHDAKSVADANAHGAGWSHSAWWGCSDNSVGGKQTMPVNCRSGIITLHITFPSCWDGVMVAGDEVAAGHVKFPSGQTCPTGFKRALPILIARFEYPVGPSSSGITLSSGPPYTAHSDFWNTWKQTRLAALTTSCLNANVDCGNNP